MKLKTLYPALAAVAILALFFLVAGCENSSQKKTVNTYVGGEIINPTSEYVILYKVGEFSDTVYLNPQNRFSYEMDSAQKGLYTIYHRPETQNFYINPGDSLLLRINTFAFDESLHFSGSGSHKNNFLAEMYLLDENNSNLLLSFYDTDPADFIKKTDSITSERLKLLNKLKEKHKFSEDFVQLAEKIIQYESFDLKERYTYLFNKYRKGSKERLPENFHDYHKKVRFNEESLLNSPAYRRFIDNYLINRSFQWCAKQAFDENNCYSLTDAENIKSRIRMVDNLIQLPALRKHFLTKLASSGIIMSKTKEDILDIIDLLERLNFPKEKIEDLKELGSIQTAYLPGTTLSNVPLINSDGTTVPFKNIITKPTIIFLWSVYNTKHKEDHALIRDLRKKYPEINFIGINLDVGETQVWRAAVRKFGYDESREFQLGPTRVDKKFFKYYLHKLLFLDASGKVIIGDAFINSPEFESRILEFLNQ